MRNKERDQSGPRNVFGYHELASLHHVAGWIDDAVHINPQWSHLDNTTGNGAPQVLGLLTRSPESYHFSAARGDERRPRRHQLTSPFESMASSPGRLSRSLAPLIPASS